MLRIVSLLPSATESLWWLGLGDQVVGVTYECNEPPEAATRPQVTDTIVPVDATPAEIDAVISSAMAEGKELYRIDRDLLSSLDPDLIVSQDLCRVCAVPSGNVADAVAELGCRAEVFSYDPMTLDGVLDEIERLGITAGLPATDAADAVGSLRARLHQLRRRSGRQPRPKVLLLEWVDPPFSAGHWIPDQIEAAGGEPVLAHRGQRSAAIEWDAVAASGAEILIVAPCGFDETAAAEQLESVLARPEVADLPAVRDGRVHAVDADAYVARPGPRLVDGAEHLATLIN